MPQMTGQERLRVLVVAHDASMFGAQRTLLTWLERADTRQFDIRVTAPAAGEFVDAVLALGMPVEIAPAMRWVPSQTWFQRVGRFGAWLRLGAWSIKGTINLVRQVSRYRIDLVYSNTVVRIDGAIAAKLLRVPHVWHIHEPTHGNPELAPLASRGVYASVIKALASRVIFCSRSVAREYPTLGGHATLVYNGLPSQDLPPDRQACRIDLAGQLSLNPQRPLVATVGAIQPRKDHGTFLKMARVLRSWHPDVACLIVGSGDEAALADLRRRIEREGLAQTVILVGRWADPIQSFLAGVDALVVSSIQESFGLTILEAFGVGTPVVSTRCGGPQEVIRDGIDGFLADVGAAADLAAHVSRLLSDQGLTTRVRLAARQRLQESFSVDQYVAGIERCISATAELVETA